jgi:signal transduction histidine kinase/BarA-like signal transduction histidine kinase
MRAMDEHPTFESDPAGVARLAKPRLLVVDDLEDNRIILTRRLARRGFEVHEAASGPEALARIAREPFDLVLLDIVMPEMDGFEVLQRIRQRHDAIDLPVIMVTVKDASADVVRALKLGANDYVNKPVDFEVVQARIAVHVARKQDKARARLDPPQTETLIAELRSAVSRAEAAARAKSDFLANMSHEIRTPLNGILGMAQVLAMNSPDPSQARVVRTIIDSAQGLERLLSDALDLSRAEVGKLEIRSEPFDLAAVVERSAALFAGAATAKTLAFEVVIDPAARITVDGDALRLQQILTNLISNAVKFTAEGRIACQVTAVASGIRFQVQDSGIGFNPAHAEALFGRFEQADGSIAGAFGGSGLGLAISRNLAELMGGTLIAVAAPGAGSCFTLDLPLAASAPTRKAAPAHKFAAGRRLRVLAADDHATNRRLMELMLNQANVELTQVSDGAAALDAVAAGDFDLILMDVQMPVLDGLSAIRAIRRREAEQTLRRTPIVALSAHALAEHEQLSKDAGADVHVTKPIQVEVLMQTLQDVRAGRVGVAAKPRRNRAAKHDHAG